MKQSELLRYVIGTLERLGTPYMVVGSFASYVYGEPRFTQNIDIVLDLPAGRVADFCAGFPDPEFYLSEPAVRDAVRRRSQFNILHPGSGNKVDCIFPGSNEWAKTQLDRRRRAAILPDTERYVASPEDVILGKLWYYSDGGSEKHLRDIGGILKTLGDQVSRADVTAWAAKLGYLEVWERVQKHVDDPNHPKV